MARVCDKCGAEQCSIQFEYDKGEIVPFYQRTQFVMKYYTEHDLCLECEYKFRKMERKFLGMSEALKRRKYRK